MHDDSYDLAYAKATLYCVPPPVTTSGTTLVGESTTNKKLKSATADKSTSEVVQSTLESAEIIVPKKFKIGQLRPVS